MEVKLTTREAKRLEIVLSVENGTLSYAEGAKRLGLTQRQLRRIRQRYAAEGFVGLASKRRGLPARNRMAEDIKCRVSALVTKHYQGFGPTLVQEKLTEQHGITLSTESVRQLMLSEGQWTAKRSKQAKLHPLRQRRARYGELIQIDGSPHHWFGETEPASTLLVFIDDATGQLMHLAFVASESTLSYMQALYHYIDKHGLPMALYSDKHSVFRINAKDVDSETQFGRAVSALGIELICANSPQAKGRVERANRTLQDRLVKELQLMGIKTLEDGNAMLANYTTAHNRRFGVVPRAPENGHVAYTDSLVQLKAILSIQQARRLSKTLTCSVDGQLMQLSSTGSGRGLQGMKVEIHWHFDGSIEVCRQGVVLPYTIVTIAPKAAVVVSSKGLNAKLDALSRQRQTQSNAHKPADNHPWKRWQGSDPPPTRGAAGGKAPLQTSG